jgi:hypothetical protein
MNSRGKRCSALEALSLDSRRQPRDRDGPYLCRLCVPPEGCLVEGGRRVDVHGVDVSAGRQQRL